MCLAVVCVEAGFSQSGHIYRCMIWIATKGSIWSSIKTCLLYNCVFTVIFWFEYNCDTYNRKLWCFNENNSDAKIHTIVQA